MAQLVLALWLALLPCLLQRESSEPVVRGSLERRVEELHLELLPPDPRVLTWDEMRCAMGYPKKLARVVSVIHLLLWHWAQVLIYTLVVFAYSNLLGSWPRFFSYMLVAREWSYMVLTLWCLMKKPGFLLFSPHKGSMTSRAHKDQALMYIFMPEKWLADVILSKLFDNMAAKSVRGLRASHLVQFITLFFDFCSLGGLVMMAADTYNNGFERFFFPLACGYASTAATSIGFIVLNPKAVAFFGFASGWAAAIGYLGYAAYFASNSETAVQYHGCVAA